jgi:hypothetical protein
MRFDVLMVIMMNIPVFWDDTIHIGFGGVQGLFSPTGLEYVTTDN